MNILIIKREVLKLLFCINWLRDFYWTIGCPEHVTNGTDQSEKKKINQELRIFPNRWNEKGHPK